MGADWLVAIWISYSTNWRHVAVEFPLDDIIPIGQQMAVVGNETKI